MAKRKARRRKRRTKPTGKSIHLGNGFRLNLSKSGISLSGGVKGARLSVGNKGVKSTLSIPGTGIRKTKTLVSTKDVIDSLKDDKVDQVKKSSQKSDAKKTESVKKEDNSKIKLNEKEQEARNKREEAQKRVEAVEAQFKTGDHKNSRQEKILDKDVAKSFIKEPLKTGWWIALILVGALILLLNISVGIGIMVVGILLVYLEYQLPKNRAKRFFNTGIELYEEKKYEESIKEMEKAILFDPSHDYMLLTLATIKFEVFDDANGAISHLTKVMEQSKNKEVIFLLGKCYFSIEEYIKTIELLQMISLRKAKERDRILLVSRSYLLTGQPKLAIEILLPAANDYVINKDELIEVNYWLGYAYLDDFDFELAKNYLDLVFHQDPEYKDIKRLIENCNS